MLTIYKASAGSGKTYTLAYEYVKLLLGVKRQGEQTYRLNSPKYLGGDALPNRHRAILAITFTNKATEEMKSRIVRELAALVAVPPPGKKDAAYAEKLMNEFGCTRDELRDVAAKSLRSLLFDYHHFNVSTIDSFFQTVLRAFAREVDRQGDYGIELNDEFAVSSGISLMLDDLNYGNPPRRREILRWIRSYTMDLIESGKDSSFFNRSGSLLRQLGKYVKRMSSEHFKRESDRVIDYLKDSSRLQAFVEALDRRISEINAGIQADTRRMIELLASNGFDYQTLKRPMPRVISAVLNSDKISIADFTKESSTLRKMMSEDDSFEPSLVFSKADVQKSSNCLAMFDELCQWVRRLFNSLNEIHSIEKVRAACPNLEFLGFTWDYIRRFREENNLILLSDTHDLLHRIIGGSDAPFIYERIGVALSHFLIDEFQDTSVMQWDNLKPLVANSLAFDADNLIIGDEKQAIYRFRNSDSSLIHHVVANQDFPHNHVIRGDNPAENTNHRSAPGIVKFNNALFTRIAAQLGVEGYENTVQSTFDAIESLSSYIKIYNTDGLTIGDMPAEFEITAREILRQHDAGYNWRDIAVLVRTGKEAMAIVDYLLKNHPEIKILSSEGLLLKNSPAIKLIIGMLKLVDKSYAESGELKSKPQPGKPAYGTVGDIRMMISRYDYFRSQNFDPSEAIRMALVDVDDVTDDIKDSIADIRSAHPAGLVSLIETIIEKKLSPARRRSEYAFIAAFQDEVIKYCQSFNPSVHAFLQWWDDKSNNLAINPGIGQDAVSVMTIHAAKGLERDCVIVPFGDWAMFKPNESVWIKPDAFDFVTEDIRPPLISVTLDNQCLLDGSLLQKEAVDSRHAQIVDSLNTIYVAYTRAKRELIICFSSQSAAGEEVITALARPDVGDELCSDLRAYILPDIGPDGLMFEYGSPTVPVSSPESKNSDQLTFDDYHVYFRDDTAALTTIDDATSSLGEIMMDDETVAADEPIQLNLFDDARAAAAERGTHLHSIMANIDTVADIDAVVSRAALRYGLSPGDEQSYLRIVSDAFNPAGLH
ncbi:MAG: UvrD-helicase domain-containing protein, partial [Muribaculaceae bacterium]|nr:UvrD-helicase domain-containing protein [Muribaculaceae bacterium]